MLRLDRVECFTFVLEIAFFVLVCVFVLLACVASLVVAGSCCATTGITVSIVASNPASIRFNTRNILRGKTALIFSTLSWFLVARKARNLLCHGPCPYTQLTLAPCPA